MPLQSPYAPRLITGPVYVLCEGPGDRAFIEMLLREHGIIGVDVGCPAESGCGGKGGFKKHLKAVLNGANGPNIKTLLVIADNEDNPASSVMECQAALNFAGGYRAPVPPGVLNAPDRTVAIHMIPAVNISGALEHLLLEALFDVNPALRTCIDEMCQCTGQSPYWKANDRAKMQLQCLLSAHCQDNPCIPLTFLWSDQNWKHAMNPIPKASPRYKPILDFLVRFKPNP